jgi:hypothetical protein
MPRRFLVYLDNKNKKLYPKDCKEVLNSLRSVFSKYSDIEIRDVRISSYFIEVDISIFDTFSIENQNQLSKEILSAFTFVGPVLYWDYLIENKSYIQKETVLDNAILLFNIERFWKSHEVLEGLWKESSGDEKKILNGLILIDAAFVHYQKNEIAVSISIIKRSLEKFKDANGMYYYLNLDEIKKDLLEIVSSNRLDTFKIFIY